MMLTMLLMMLLPFTTRAFTRNARRASAPPRSACRTPWRIIMMDMMVMMILMILMILNHDYHPYDDHDDPES